MPLECKRGSQFYPFVYNLFVHMVVFVCRFVVLPGNALKTHFSRLQHKVLECQSFCGVVGGDFVFSLFVSHSSTFNRFPSAEISASCLWCVCIRSTIIDSRLHHARISTFNTHIVRSTNKKRSFVFFSSIGLAYKFPELFFHFVCCIEIYVAERNKVAIH